ncbi:S8 family peptidase [Aminipila luticellarii]|uniref:Peptidase S8 n=1 Tax=Aminipila luticellarii TaxID=2507160 RepID=A0A410PS85_9FIRM|nr:S8 family peptidase [Aminipila luticellarii]QAT41773.1 peptidase S8 [Aminipila luticellarii]
MKNNKGTMPVIIYSKKNMNQTRQCILDNYGKIKYELPFINALCVEVPIKKLSKIKCNANISLISMDAEVSKLPIETTSVLNDPFSLIGKKNAKNKKLRKSVFSGSLCGEGVTIAIIDTGISPHYDIIKPANRIVAFKDFINNSIVPYDDDGHGTHVAGLAAGNGYMFGGNTIVETVRDMFPDKATSIICMGTAPKANIAALKALDFEGNGNTSDILAAMQWVADNHQKYNIRVLNLSLGIDAASFDIDGDGFDDIADPLVLGTNALVNMGITIVVAAGNSGPKAGSITSPGTSPYVITVGSINSDGEVPDFSSRGPTATGAIKPDILAPGMNVLSLDAVTNKRYIRQSGTSMSAPFVSGAAACLHAANPHLTPAQVKEYLMRTAIPQTKADRNCQGSGLLNI